VKTERFTVSASQLNTTYCLRTMARRSKRSVCENSCRLRCLKIPTRTFSLTSHDHDSVRRRRTPSFSACESFHTASRFVRQHPFSSGALARPQQEPNQREQAMEEV
jgi:hypothetical protein